MLRAGIPALQEFPWWSYYPAYFSFLPIAYGFALGQDCALMLFLLALFTLALREKKDFRAGCFLGLALIKFQLVLPLVLILVLKKQFRVLGGFSVMAGCLAAISVWIAGWDGLTSYPGNAAATGGTSGSCAERCAEDTPSARSLPDRICGSAGGIPMKAICTCPPIRSVMANAPPL